MPMPFNLFAMLNGGFAMVAPANSQSALDTSTAKNPLELLIFNQLPVSDPTFIAVIGLAFILIAVLWRKVIPGNSME
jgi:hypothetical protein